MKILIDIGHPGHVHLFKNFAHKMIENGYTVLFTCREKEFEIELLKAEGFEYVSFGKHYKKLVKKLWGLVKFNFKLLKLAFRYKPDIFLSAGSMYASHAAFLYRKPHITFEDTGNMEQVRLYLPFTKYVFTPQALNKKLGKNQVEYNSFHELAYLNPDIFYPDTEIYKFLGIEESEKYVLLRFVAWNATHDLGLGGLTAEQKSAIVDHLLKKGYRIFISSEGELPEALKAYRIKIPPEKIHHVLSFADFTISEGATMASESGVLGTPCVYVNGIRACNVEDLENYSLAYNLKPGTNAVTEILAAVDSIKPKTSYTENLQAFLENKVDINSFLVWFITNYPKSGASVKDDGKTLNKFQFSAKTYR